MRRFYLGQAEPLSDDEVAGIAISAGVKRDGDEWVPSGVDLGPFRQNPIICRNHDTNQPVGTASAIGLTADGDVGIRIQFAPPGVSAVADETRGLVKSGVMSALSAGIMPSEVEPLDARNPRGGVRILRCELLEVSFVAVPADTSARILQRSYRTAAVRAASVRRLPAVTAAALRRASAAFAGNPQHRRLAEIAAHFGRTLTPARLDQIIEEARRFGQDPAWRLQFVLVQEGAVRA